MRHLTIWRAVGIACLGIGAGTGSAAAQMGQLDLRTEFAVLEGTSTPNQHGPLLAIVLWKGPPGWREPSGPARVRADSVYRWTRLRADEQGFSFFGSGVAYGLIDRKYDALTIENSVFSIAPRDSAVVVMVTIPVADGPRAVAAARLPVNAIPEAFWLKTWQSGDTTFTVRPGFPRMTEMLREALLRVPDVAVFLR